MAQADSNNTTAAPVVPTRRQFMSQGASIAAGSAAFAMAPNIPALAEAPQRLPDPILVAIEAHKAAYAARSAALDQSYDLEEALPGDRRQSRIDAWETKIIETDDPRWIEAQRALEGAYDAEVAAEIELINIVPDTLAGAAALMRYVTTMEAKGHSWADGLQDDDEKPSKIGKSWEEYLHRNIAALLDAQAD